MLTKSVILMQTNKQDTFLIGHTRRMRECRKRQRQQDPELYANRVKMQQREYRLCTRSKILSAYQTTQQLESILKLRKANRE